MIQWLMRRFVRDNGDPNSPEAREAYGTLGTVTGVALNVLLALGKFLMGLLTGSLAMTADAANNFSDAAGGLVALVSVRMAAKQSDREHPYGHGRMEYIGALGVGLIILMMGAVLLRDGVAAILSPKELSFSWAAVGVMVASVLLKLWMYFFYRTLARRIGSDTLLAAAKDSLSDVLATGAVLASLAVQFTLGWEADGYIGVLVALVVIKTGYGVCRDTVGRLLGGKPDPEKARRLRELLMGYEGILGVHDVALHDYGPGRCVASVHAEVSAKSDIVAIHEVIDRAEREIGEELRMPICIHMDPIVTDDERTNEVHLRMVSCLQSLVPEGSLHDFRIAPAQDHENVIFDCVLPAGYRDRDALVEKLEASARALDERYRLVVRFDTDYT